MNLRCFRVPIIFGLALMLATQSAAASPTLKLNSTGPNVLLLQQKLKLLGYEIKELDGVYGNETEKAVTKFQHDQNISATGVVNNATWRALKGLKEDPSIKLPAPDKIPAYDKNPSSNLKLVPNGRQILPKSKVSALIGTARKYIGVPYAFGGTTPRGFDCSGYLQYVFAKHGIGIPRLADEQYRLGLAAKSAKDLVPGDLVFFTTYTSGASHCGIYLGKNEFIHTSSSKGVRIDNLNNDYWKPRFIGGRRIVK